jgi:WD40 repeat protein
MKKILILFAFLLGSVGLFAQASGTLTTFLSNETTKIVTPLATDTVSGTNVKYWTFAINKPYLSYFAFVTEIDSTLRPARIHGNRVAIKTYGSCGDANGLVTNAVWVQIGSTIFKGVNAGTSGDSTLCISDVSTGVLYKFLKLEFTGVVADHCATIPKITLKVAAK